MADELSAFFEEVEKVEQEQQQVLQEVVAEEEEEPVKKKQKVVEPSSIKKVVQPQLIHNKDHDDDDFKSSSNNNSHEIGVMAPPSSVNNGSSVMMLSSTSSSMNALLQPPSLPMARGGGGGVVTNGRAAASMASMAVAAAASQQQQQHQPLGIQPKLRQRENVTKRTAAGKMWEDPTLSEWPENDYRLFVGNLGKDTNRAHLEDAFRHKYKSFVMAKIVYDKQMKSKGFGFVSFLDPMDAAKALREMNDYFIGSRPIKVKKSEWQDRDLKTVQKKEKQDQKMKKQLFGVH